MELGTGVFLSSALLGAITLFIATKDKWNWKKIILRTFISVIAIIGLGSGGAYLYINHENWPHAEHSLLGVSLGMEKAEVKFLKSEPTNVRDNAWEYVISDNQKYIIEFQKERVSSVYFVYDPHTAGNIFQELQGIWFSSGDQQKIFEHFGKQAKVKWGRGQLSKILSYPKYNVFFLLTKNRLRIMGIYDSSAWEPTFGDIELLVTSKRAEEDPGPITFDDIQPDPPNKGSGLFDDLLPDKPQLLNHN